MRKIEVIKDLIKPLVSLFNRSVVRDLIILTFVILAVVSWQTRDMLNTNGEVLIDQRNLVSLEGTVIPFLVNDKPNLVYFFAPWCTICDLSIENLNYLNKNKINVVAIALDYSSKEEVEEFIEKNNVSAKVLMGNEHLKQEFAIQGYPSYYLIDENQRIQAKSYGYSTAIGLKLRELFN